MCKIFALALLHLISLYKLWCFVYVVWLLLQTFCSIMFTTWILCVVKDMSLTCFYWCMSDPPYHSHELPFAGLDFNYLFSEPIETPFEKNLVLPSPFELNKIESLYWDTENVPKVINSKFSQTFSYIWIFRNLNTNLKIWLPSLICCQIKTKNAYPLLLL